MSQNCYFPLKKGKAASETSFGINLLAFCIATSFLPLAYNFGLKNTPYLFLLYACLLTVFQTFFEYLFFKRTSVLARWKIRRPVSLKRVAYKEITFFVTIGVIAFFYWLFPVYHSRMFTTEYFPFLKCLVPLMIILSIPYFCLMDKIDEEPDDVYYKIGYAIAHFKKTLTRFEFSNYVRIWLVKAFWLALMQPAATNHIDWLMGLISDISVKDLTITVLGASTFCFFIDLAYASTGYLMNLKILNSQTRTAEPSLFGWVVAVMCYWPFWGVLFYPYFFKYTKFNWQQIIPEQNPIWWIWFTMIIVLELLYALATVAAGIRFSNLTYRGLWNTGLYKYTKHPAYVFKNISWWLISVPFMAQPFSKAFRLCLLLFANNIIYYLRARTEERHLSHYPEYVEYAQMMNDKSIFRWVAKLLPFLKYKALQKKDRLF